jgi:hypothetical protein
MQYFTPKVMMSKTLLTLFVVSWLPIASVNAKIKVVANIDSEVSLSRQEVKSLFLGGGVQHNLTPLALNAGNTTRLNFNTHVLGLTESRIQSYWAQMRFSGKSKPPREFATEEVLLQYVQNHSGSVAYISSNTEVPEGLTVVYQVD